MSKVTSSVTIGSSVKQGNKAYIVSNEEIESGDLVWSLAERSIEKCIAVFDKEIVIQFSDGMRALLQKEKFQKLIPE